MKKFCLLFIALLILLPYKVVAEEANVTLGIECHDANIGNSTKCDVYLTPTAGVSAAKGNISINGNAIKYTSSEAGALNGTITNNAFNLYGSTQNQRFKLFTLNFNAESVGTATVNVTLTYIADGEFNDVELTKSVSATINVVDPTPISQIETNNSNNSNNQNSNNSTNTSNNSSNKSNNVKKEETKEEVVEEIKEELKITKFEIVGYELLFNKEKYEYELEISSSVSDLYIIVEGENISVNGAGKVNIAGEKEIVVTITSGEAAYNYKIRLNRIDNNTVTTVGTNSNTSWSNRDKLLLSGLIISLVANIGFIGTNILKNSNKRRINVRKIAN